VHDWHLLEIGQLDLATFITRTVEKSPTHLNGATFDPMAFFTFLRSAPFGVHWMVVARARELHQAGYKTAILTNNVREWGEGWKSTIPMDLFDAVIDSSDVGVRKPDPEIYRIACERLAVEPGTAVFLDDNEANVKGARAVGMEAVLVGKDVWAALAELDTILTRRG
jgi:epoxide hydrolase-like predicted phosphatase